MSSQITSFEAFTIGWNWAGAAEIRRAYAQEQFDKEDALAEAQNILKAQAPAPAPAQAPAPTSAALCKKYGITSFEANTIGWNWRGAAEIRRAYAQEQLAQSDALAEAQSILTAKI